MDVTQRLLIALALFVLQSAHAQQESALTCADFRPTEQAVERFPELRGACEAIVERDGELYARFSAVVRRPGNSEITIYIPAVDRTMQVTPRRDARVQIGNRKLRPSDLNRGQQFSIYLAVSEFGKPNIDEIAFITEENLIVEHRVATAMALPATASPWPLVALVGGLALVGGAVTRRLRRQG